MDCCINDKLQGTATAVALQFRRFQPNAILIEIRPRIANARHKKT